MKKSDLKRSVEILNCIENLERYIREGRGTVVLSLYSGTHQEMLSKLPQSVIDATCNSIKDYVTTLKYELKALGVDTE